MKPLQHCHRGGWTGKTVPFAIRLIIVAAMALHVGGVVRAGGTVTSCTEASLRAAMAGGGTVTFACDGTITLTNTLSTAVNTLLDGSGHQITISGNHAVPLFYVGTDVTLTLSNLTIADGYSVGAFATSGAGPGDPALVGRGGAIYNDGNLLLEHCVFTNNQALGGDVFLGYGGSGQGGAIFN